MFGIESEILAMMKSKFTLFIPIILFIIVCFFLWRGLSLNPRELPSPFINKPIPQFTLPELYHPDQNFSSTELRGHVTLLNIFASWCISCRVEHAQLMALKNQRAVLIYGLDYKDSPNDVLKWLNKSGNPYERIGFDQIGNTAINLGVYGTPETFVIDKLGIVRYKYIGPITKDVWESELQPEVEKLARED